MVSSFISLDGPNNVIIEGVVPGQGKSMDMSKFV